MRRVIVTVVPAGAGEGMDLDLPADADVGGLAPALARALGLGAGSCRVEAMGRTLGPDDTLAGAGVLDGGWLILHDTGN